MRSWIVLYLGLLASPAHAASVTLDLNFLSFANPPDSPFVTEGLFSNSVVATFDESLLRPGGRTLVAFDQLDTLTVDLPSLRLLGDEFRTTGTCLTQSQLPLCGFVFDGATPVGLIGQYSVAGSGANFRLNNSHPSLARLGLDFLSSSIEDQMLGVSVAGAEVRELRYQGRLGSAAPVPEPSTWAILALGLAAVGWRKYQSKLS